MEIAIIAAVAKNGVIGNRGNLPWYLPDDLKRFKELTMGYAVIMGRNTYESIVRRIGKPLPRRKNIVLTSQDKESTGEVVYFKSMNAAIDYARGQYERAFVIGGQRVFEEAIDIADRLELTLIDRDFEGDIYFPNIDYEKWSEVKRSDRMIYGDMSFSFVTYERRK